MTAMPHRTPSGRPTAPLRIALVVVAGLALAATASADTVSLQDFLFSVNGTTSCPDAACGGSLTPAGLDATAFDFTTGLGTLVMTFNPGAAGAYFIDLFLDPELHGPFFNEYGAVSGAPAAGVSWQIDEPGFGDGNRLGTIFDNTMAGTLDDTNHVPGALSNAANDCGGNAGGTPTPACNNDVALALGFEFALAADEQAVLTWTSSLVAPTGGFFLTQIDPDSPNALFLSGALTIEPSTQVPEPSTLLLLLGGLMSAGFRNVRRAHRGAR